MRPASRRFRHFAVAAVTGTAAALIPLGMAAASTTAPAASTLRIHTVLGSGHVSPYAGQTVSGVPGVVTDVTSSSFYLQDPSPVGGTPFTRSS